VSVLFGDRTQTAEGGKHGDAATEPAKRDHCEVMGTGFDTLF